MRPSSGSTYDGYPELRFWYPPGTPPAQITATALRALDAVTSPLPGTGGKDAAAVPLLPAAGPLTRGTEACTGSRRLPRDTMTFPAEEGSQHE